MSDLEPVRRALVEQRVGELLAAARSAADHGFQLGVVHDVRELPTLCRDARVGQHLPDLRAREIVPIPHRVCD